MGIILSGLIMLVTSIFIFNAEKIVEVALSYISNIYNYIHDLIFDIKTKRSKWYAYYRFYTRRAY